MALSLTAEQVLLKDSLERFVEKKYSFETRNAILGSNLRFDSENWQRFAELGWLSILVPNTCLGSKSGAVDQMVICEGLGKALVLEPYITNAVLCTKAIEFGTDEALKRLLLGEIATGMRLFALAFTERASRYDLHHVEARAEKRENQFILNGEKIAVLDAPIADCLIVAARTHGKTRDSGGIGLFLVDAGSPGLELRSYTTLAGATAADIAFREVGATVLVEGSDGVVALETAVDYATAAACAYATGAMEVAFKQTLEYVKIREQFGVAIGSFQVIRHRMVDLMIAVRECQSMCLKTSAELDSSKPRKRRRSVSAAKAFIGKRARMIAKEAVQMHGGIGMTEEIPIGHFFRALTQFTTVFGSTAHHLEYLAETYREKSAP